MVPSAAASAANEKASAPGRLVVVTVTGAAAAVRTAAATVTPAPPKAGPRHGVYLHHGGPVTVAEVAASIGAGLAKAALGGKVNGQLVDTSFSMSTNANLAIVTAKDPEGLELIRHSTAHLLAYAVKDLFPEAQVTIGPVIDNGFYYDFSYSRPFTPEDLVAIEKRMTELANKDEPVVRRVLPRDEAVAYFKGLGEHYKAEIIASIPADQEVSLYREGNFEDLCRGPHVPSTGKLKHFKLMKVAGAYWRGDSKNEMLQRVYGTAWASKEDLQQYLVRLNGEMWPACQRLDLDDSQPGTWSVEYTYGVDPPPLGPALIVAGIGLVAMVAADLAGHNALRGMFGAATTLVAATDAVPLLRYCAYPGLRLVRRALELRDAAPTPLTLQSYTVNGVATLEIARPEKKNAITVAMYQAMADALLDAEQDSDGKSTMQHRIAPLSVSWTRRSPRQG